MALAFSIRSCAVHTVPQDAIIQDFPQRTFADMRESMVLGINKKNTFYQDEDDDVHRVAIGCGASLPPSSTSPAYTGDIRINRRRLGMVDNGNACNNVTNFFCWMSCLDIPQAKNATDLVSEGYSLYCVDPQVLSQTDDVSKASKECAGGFNHNAACMGSWEKTAPGVPAASVVVDQDALLNFEESFCYGGTSMYMDGFHWTDSVCVIYLFPQWILSSAGSMVGASIGTIGFGIALEGVIWKRRDVVNSLPVGWARLGVTSLFYGLQLTMGYFLMLVVMTYSAPLFLCVIVGLMSGHFLFNAISMMAKNKKSTARATNNGVDSENYCPCDGEADSGCVVCTANANTSDEDDSKSVGSGDDIPEGSTPCCQHSL